jgi:hypothetical protein
LENEIHCLEGFVCVRIDRALLIVTDFVQVEHEADLSESYFAVNAKIRGEIRRIQFLEGLQAGGEPSIFLLERAG